VNLLVKDIDVHITTLVANSTTNLHAEYDVNFPILIFTLNDKTGQELPGHKQDIEMISSGMLQEYQAELPELIDKYNRMTQRLKLLKQCFSK
jgi:hypothetical protein